jgi:GntR family transcriptional regulator
LTTRIARATLARVSEALLAGSPLPLYHQLADWLLLRIRSGEYPPGSRIPSEPALARRFGIGRPTVRQATDLLVRRRCLERRRGSGTWVVAPPERVDLLSLAGTLVSFERAEVPVRTALLQRAKRVHVEPDPENPVSGREAWFVSRVSRAGGEGVLLEDIWLDASRFPDLDRHSLAGRSLSRLVEEQYRLRPESAEQTFRVVGAGARRAGALGCAASQPLLLVKRTLHFPNARAAIFTELACRTDRLVFSQTLGAPSHA